MLSEEKAKLLLEPYHAALSRIVTTAWSKWQTTRVYFEDPFKRTAAVVIHQFMVEEARREFFDCPNVHFTEQHETLLISFGDEIAVCLKKLSQHLRTSNYPTPRQQDFFGQMSLPGVPDCVRVVVGYVQDPLGIDITVHVVYAKGDETIWSYPLPEQRGQELAVVDAVAMPNHEPTWNFVPKTDEDSSKERSAS